MSACYGQEEPAWNMAMLLPHHQAAVVKKGKLVDYLLAEGHPSGQHKARFFLSLGFRPDRHEELRAALLQHAANHAVSSTRSSRFGTRYVVDGPVQGPGGRIAQVRCVWFIASGEVEPQLVTAYPLRGFRS